MPKKIRSALFLALFLGALAVSQIFHSQSMSIAQENKLARDHNSSESTPEYILMSSLLGGLRGLFLTALWIHAENLRQAGQYYEMVDVYNLICRLQPGHTAAWGYLSWDMAYNISAETGETPAEKSYWVFRSINLLRLRGIKLNPDNPDLYQELAWIFLNKVGDTNDSSHSEYRRRLAQDIVSTFGTYYLDESLLERLSQAKDKYKSVRQLKNTSEYQQLEARLKKIAPKVDLFRDAPVLIQKPPEKLSLILNEPEVKQYLESLLFANVAWRASSRLGMDVTKMLKITRWHNLGAIDWRLPEAHAVYWAREARTLHKELYAHNSSAKDLYILNHGIMNLVTSGDVLALQDGTLICVPNYQYLDPAIAIMNEAIVEFDEELKNASETRRTGGSSESMREGFKNFLISMALNAYLDNSPQILEKLRKELLKLTGDKKYAQSIDAFINDELAKRLETIKIPEARTLIQTFYAAACNQLSKGAIRVYQRRNRQIQRIYNFVRLNVEKKYENASKAEINQAFPPLVELKRIALYFIINNKMPNFKDNKERTKTQALLRYLRQAEPDIIDGLQRQPKKQLPQNAAGPERQ